MLWRRSRRGREARRSAARLAAAALAVAAVGGCAEVAPRPTAPTVSPSDRAFLLPPATGYPGSVDVGLARALDDLHHRLVTEGAAPELRAGAQQLVRERPGDAPPQVLLAQLELAGGDPDAAATRLRAVVETLPDYAAAQLAYGRAVELLGDLPEAFEAYRRIAAEVAAAASRAGELEPRALEIVSNRLRSALASGDLELAGQQLGRLEAWAPDGTPTLEGAARLAAARGDARAELRAVRELRRRSPGDMRLRDRLATLEVAAGDPGAGISILQEMAAERPGDPEIEQRLAAARFRWRLVLLPSEVRETTRSPELTRAQLAAQLYWLFPSVRYARPQSARIANDVFDHEFRTEIVRVINLDLMAVDPGLHQFAPLRAATRADALAAILKVVVAGRPDEACLGAAAASKRLSWPIACAAAASCGLIATEADCLPAAVLSGADAVELSRRAQQLIGGE